MKVVILGGGNAGIAAATRLRRINENAEILVLEKSPEFAVARCGLTYLLSGQIKNKEDLIGATAEQMRDIFRITVRTEHEVIGINRAQKLVMLQNRPPESYDKLIIATGREQRRPDITGILGENIFTLQSLANVERVRDYYAEINAGKALIVGGGNIGVEAAEAFASLKAKVTIADKGQQILPHLDEDMAQIAAQELRRHGVRLILGRQISAFREQTAKFDNGRKISFDIAIIATGARPNVKLPILAGLEIGDSGGIEVNNHMQTSDPDIYACGDNVEVINHISKMPEHWPNAASASKQARVAADHIGGLDSRFGEVINTNITKVFDYTVAATGCTEKKLQLAGIRYHKLYLQQLSHAGYYPQAEKIFLKLLFAENGKILGLQMAGKNGVAERINAVSVQLQHNAEITDLIDEEVAFAPPYATAKDALNNLGSMAQEVLQERLRLIGEDELNGQIVPVDIRSPQNFVLGHLPDALNFPLAKLRQNLDRLPKDQNIALYDNSGYGAYLAYQILSQHGFEKISMLNRLN